MARLSDGVGARGVRAPVPDRGTAPRGARISRKRWRSVDRARKRGVGAEISRADTLRGPHRPGRSRCEEPGDPPARGNPPPAIPIATGGLPGNLGGQVGLPTPTFPDPQTSGGGANPAPGVPRRTASWRGPQNPDVSWRDANPPSTPPADPGRRGTATPPPADREQSALTQFFNGDYAGGGRRVPRAGRQPATTRPSSPVLPRLQPCGTGAQPVSADRATLGEARAVLCGCRAARPSFAPRARSSHRGSSTPGRTMRRALAVRRVAFAIAAAPSFMYSVGT